MKKILKFAGIFLLVASLAAAVVMLTSCKKDGKSTYTITFVTPDGVANVPSITAEPGTPIMTPDGPEYAGHRFVDWRDTLEMGGSVNLLPATMPDRDMTFYAYYVEEVKTVTITYVAEGKDFQPEVGEVGGKVWGVHPEKTGYHFDGWYTNARFEGNPVELPTVFPQNDVTYYAKYTKLYHELFFDENHPSVGGLMTSVFADTYGKVTIPSVGYEADGYYLLGWTDTPDGKLLFNANGEVTQGYSTGTELTLTADKTLYAQWAYGYTDLEGSGDTVYIHMGNVESGIGQAVLVREGKPVKIGFIGIHKDYELPEFTFYFDESEGGETRGLIYAEGAFLYRDALYGFHLGYDHISDQALGEMLYADGYGSAGVFTTVGAQLVITAYGEYMFDETYNEYVFVEIDPATGDALKDENGQNQGFYFTVEAAQIDDVAPPSTEDSDAALVGYFLRLGEEAGPYYLYENGEMGDYMLELNGYGWARLYRSVNGEATFIADGAYNATENYTSIWGEWEFIPASTYSDATPFRFVTTYTTSGTQVLYLYITYDETCVGTFTATDGSTIEMDGYGGMSYTSPAGVLTGSFQYLAGDASPNLTFYAYNEDGDRVATMYFDVDWVNKTFAVNNAEFVLDENGVIVSYRGSSKIVIIPAEIDGRAVTGIADNAFKAIIGDDGEIVFSVEQVTIPASVTHIGSLAFQNNYTLHRVTFLGAVPPAIDFATAKDPFRWPAGDFAIVVPEANKAAYIEAFTNAWTNAGRDASELYRIKGAMEVTLLPEFEVDENGTLIAYNRPSNADPDALVDLVITVGKTEHDGVDIKITAIAPEIFMGATWLRSIDLGDVTVIGEAAFENCTALETVVMNKVTTIGTAAFYGCEKLGSQANGKLELPAVTTIGASAFAWCSSLKYVVTGTDLVSVEANAFSYIKTDADLTTPFFFELTGTTPPALRSGMSGTESLSVFAGNSAYRIIIPDMDYAKICYATSGWNSFCGSLYISSGVEAGTYLDGANVLVIDGRAVLNASSVWLYEINGETITFYEYIKESASYITLQGTIKDGVITFTYEGTTFTFAKGEGPMTFTSTDGLYSLVVDDPAKLNPDLYMKQYVDATLNGIAVKLFIENYNAKTISGVEIDGVKYDFTIYMGENDTFTYKQTLSALTFAAADGSTIRLYGTTHNLADVSFKSLQYRTATEIVSVANYTSTHSVQSLRAGLYAVAFQRSNDYYVVIIETNGTAFTYHVGEAGRTAVLYTAEAGDEAMVFMNEGTVTGMALMIEGAYTEVTVTATETGYTATSVADPTVSYTVTLDTTSGVVEIISNV